MSTEDIRKGRELIVKYNDAKLKDLSNFSLSVEGNEIDVSNWDSGDWNETISGRKSWNLSVTAHNTEHIDSGSTQALLNEDHIDGGSSGSIEIAPESPESGDVTYSGSVVCTSFNLDAGGDDEPIESSWEFTGNGALTRSTQA